ncbi:MAG: hypothetical protein FJ224_09715 [Lentisphaerae bacterium]|nr:hypothetical protein [Lentisphaerota bacterium]
MHGRPIIQWLLFLGFWTCLALPVVLVTRGGRTVQRTLSSEGASVMTWVSLRFSEKPSYFELVQHDKVLWREGSADVAEFDNSFPVLIDEFGAELVLKSRLPGAGVIEITVEPDKRHQRSRTLWVDGEVDETLTFSWSRDD